jgi:hypothetical protein
MQPIRDATSNTCNHTTTFDFSRPFSTTKRVIMTALTDAQHKALDCVYLQWKVSLGKWNFSLSKIWREKQLQKEILFPATFGNRSNSFFVWYQSVPALYHP